MFQAFASCSNEFLPQEVIIFENFCDHFRVLSFSLSQELMVQKADVNASLEAARSVLASQCDAEAGKGDWLHDQGGIAWVYWDRPIGPRLYILRTNILR